MNVERAFHAYGAEHLLAISLTLAVPFVLAALVRRSKSKTAERIVVITLFTLLFGNYLAYLIFTRQWGELSWFQMLPMQMCDWAMAVIVIALWTGHPRWFEVAYFWGLGGALQAVLTPDLRYGFPDPRFLNFFVAHSGIIIGVIFLMLTRRLRPYPISVVRVFAWSEVYFVIAMMVDYLTGVNYGYLLHKPEAFSLLSYLSEARAIYLLEMHALALIFFAVLYLPFAIYDLARRTR